MWKHSIVKYVASPPAVYQGGVWQNGRGFVPINRSNAWTQEQLNELIKQKGFKLGDAVVYMGSGGEDQVDLFRVNIITNIITDVAEVTYGNGGNPKPYQFLSLSALGNYSPNNTRANDTPYIRFDDAIGFTPITDKTKDRLLNHDYVQDYIKKHTANLGLVYRG